MHFAVRNFYGALVKSSRTNLPAQILPEISFPKKSFRVYLPADIDWENLLAQIFHGQILPEISPPEIDRDVRPSDFMPINAIFILRP